MNTSKHRPQAPTVPARFRRALFRLGLVVGIPVLALFGWVLAGAFGSNRGADCIFVPGAAVRSGRKPSDALAYRLQHALDLYRAGRASRIMVSGGGHGDYAEAEIMADWLIDKGVPETAILRETASDTTRENTRNSAALLREHGIRRVLVCTQWFHVMRVSRCLEQEGFATLNAPCGGNALIKEPYFVAREMVALPVYALRLDELR